MSHPGGSVNRLCSLSAEDRIPGAADEKNTAAGFPMDTVGKGKIFGAIA